MDLAMWKRYLMLSVLVSIELFSSHVLYSYLYKWVEMQFYHENELKEISPILEVIASITVKFFFTGILAVIMGLLSVTLLSVMSVLLIGFFCGSLACIMLAIYSRLSRNSYGEVSASYNSNAKNSFFLIMFLWLTEPLKVIIFLQQFPTYEFLDNLITICGIICGSRELGKISAVMLQMYLKSNEGLFLPYLTSLMSAGLIFTCLLLACAINQLLFKPRKKFYIFNVSQYFSLNKHPDNRRFMCKITIPEMNAAIADQVKSILIVTSPLIVFWVLYPILILTWEWQFASATRAINIEFRTIYPIINFCNIVLISVFYRLKKNRIFKRISADTPDLRRIFYGFFLALIALIATALIQYEIELTTEPRPDIGNGQIKIYNAISEPLKINTPHTSILISTGMHHTFRVSKFDKGESYTNFLFKAQDVAPFSRSLYAVEKESVAYVVYLKSNKSGQVVRLENFEPINYGPCGIKNQFKVTIIIFNVHLKGFLSFKDNKEVQTIELPAIGETKILSFEPKSYQLYMNIYRNGNFIGNKKYETMDTKPGAVYAIFTFMNTDGSSSLKIKKVYERSSNIVDLVIYLTIYLGSLGQTMVTLSVYRFIYTESPGEVMPFLASVQFLYESFSFVVVTICIRYLTFTITSSFLFLFIVVFLVAGVGYFIISLNYIYIPWNRKKEIEHSVTSPSK